MMCDIPRRETLTVEFKSDVKRMSDSDLLDVVVAFANTQGGTLYLGVEDDGTPTGLHPSHLDITRLSAFIANKTVPPVSTQASVLQADDQQILQLIVPRKDTIVATSSGKILRRRIKLDGTPENVPLYPYEMATRLSSLSLLDLSAQPVSGATLADFSPVERERLRSIIRQYRGEKTLLELSDEELDKALQLVKQQDGKAVPTLAGLLLLGKQDSLQRLVPTAESAIQIFAGTQLRVNESFILPLLAAFEKIQQYFVAYNTSTEMFVNLYRLDIPHYEPLAFREALVNAYSHRDYSMLGRVIVQIENNGLTISNPGGLIQGLRYDALLEAEPRGRNPVLADCLKRIGLAERSGRGIDSIYGGSLRYGRALPDYSASSTEMVRVFIPDNPPDEPFIAWLAAQQAQRVQPFSIYELIALHTAWQEQKISADALSDRFRLNLPKLQATLENLVATGFLQVSGREKHHSYTLRAQPKTNAVHESSPALQADDYVVLAGQISQAVRQQGRITRREVAALLHINPSQAYRLLDKMCRREILQRHGSGKAAYYQFYG